MDCVAGEARSPLGAKYTWVLFRDLATPLFISSPRGALRSPRGSGIRDAKLKEIHG